MRMLWTVLWTRGKLDQAKSSLRHVLPSTQTSKVSTAHTVASACMEAGT